MLSIYYNGLNIKSAQREFWFTIPYSINIRILILWTYTE
nr:MAG TPA: hypothetical protein [Caudoviricetes sp.]